MPSSITVLVDVRMLARHVSMMVVGRAHGRARGSAGAAAGDADVMAELSRVPLGQRHWPWSDRRQAAGADAHSASRPRFVFVMLLCAVEM